MCSYPHLQIEIWSQGGTVKETDVWSYCHYHILEVTIASITFTATSPGSPVQFQFPKQGNLEHFSLVISSLTKIFISNFCIADIWRYVKILGSKKVMWKKVLFFFLLLLLFVFYPEQNIIDFIIKYLLHVFVWWICPPKTSDLMLSLQGRVLLLWLFFLFCFSTWCLLWIFLGQHKIRSY